MVKPKRRLSTYIIFTLSIFFISNQNVSSELLVKLSKRTIETRQLTGQSLRASALVGNHIIIQFNNPVTDFQRESLALDGIFLISYIPDFAYTAFLESEISQSKIDNHDIRWFDSISPTDKISPMIDEIGIGDWARRGGDLVQFAIIIHKDEDLDARALDIERDFGAEIIGLERSVGIIELILPEDAMYRLSELDFVLLIEEVMPPQVITNNSSRTNTGADILQAAPYNLDGSGVTVAEWDGGHAEKTHNDLSGRVSYGDGASVSNHATHVAGTVIGDGTNSGGTYRGMAPAASIVSFLWWGTSSELTAEYETAISAYGAKIATNSWGLGVGSVSETSCNNLLGNYFSSCAALDNTIRGGIEGPILICWSAGNERGGGDQYCGSIGWTYGTIGVYGTSKNTVTVGAINSNNSTMTGFSSWGPTDDGRIKPDVVGPGCQTSSDFGVTSTSSSGGYTVFCGTSMSTPAVAGITALMYQQWKLTFLVGSVLPSTMKGILINTAEDLGKVGPDYSYGHGKVDGVKAVEKVKMGEPSYFESIIAGGSVHLYDLTIPGGTSKLKATLVWDDPGGTGISGATLINDLDLTLIDPFSGEEFPWVLDENLPQLPATTGIDRINNVETVEIDNPTPGLWKARVTGFNIPEGPQKYSLIFTPDSIYTPGNLAALAVFDQADSFTDPGQPTSADFWITNIGANVDSIAVVITDNNFWLTDIIDTTIVLAPWDSVFFSAAALVPAGAFSVDLDSVKCTATSLYNPGVTISSYVVLGATAFYSAALGTLDDDTSNSPEEFHFQLLVENNGNAVDLMNLITSSEQDWDIVPTNKIISLQPYSDTIIDLRIYVPAEVAHLTTDNILSRLFSTGGTIDSAEFQLLIENQYFPPDLILPQNEFYTQDRSITFEWSGSGDSSTLFIGTDPEVTNIIRTYSGLISQTTTIPSADSLDDGLYYWAVKQYFGDNPSSIQASPFLFIIDNVPPNSLAPVSPVNGVYVPFNSVNLVFGNASSEQEDVLSTEAPEFAIIEFSQDPDFLTAVSTFEPISGSAYLAEGPLPQGRWYWKVKKADSAGNESSFSPVTDFLLDSETPSVPVQLLPAHEAFIKDTLVLVWKSGDTAVPYETTPDSYQLQLYDVGFSILIDTILFSDSLPLSTSLFENGEMYTWRLRASDSAGNISGYQSQPFKFTYQFFICGDFDGRGDGVTISDLTFMVSYLFKGGPAPDPLISGSITCDEETNVADLTRMVSYLFKMGDPPCCL